MQQFILYMYASIYIYIGRTFQQFDKRVNGHINDALKNSPRKICQQIMYDIQTKGIDYVKKNFKIIDTSSRSHDELCELETSYIRMYRPCLNMTKPNMKKRVTKVTKISVIKQPPILKKHEKRYIINKPDQTKHLIDKASCGHKFKNKRERLKLIKRIANQYPDWE